MVVNRQSLGSEGLKRKVLALNVGMERQSPSDGWCSNSYGLVLGKGVTEQLKSCRKEHLIPSPGSLTPDLEVEASLPEKKGNTLSRDLIDYVRYMVENHGEDYKVSDSALAGRTTGARWEGTRIIRDLICLPSAYFLRLSGSREERL